MKRKYAVHISIESTGSILVDAKSKKEAVEKAREQVGKCCPSVKDGLRGLKLDENVTFYEVNSADCRPGVINRIQGNIERRFK
jgi:hypothetical protein